MNAKKHAKHRRRTSKLNPKLDRGNQHRRVTEGKSNIGAKRITLLPGFLINGFTSGTAKKTRGHDINKTKDHLLTENLQAFLEQKSNLRRSQRILKKHNYENATCTSNNNPCDDFEPLYNSSPNLCPSNLSFKSILKKNSKSIFKEISDKFSRVNIQTNLLEQNQIVRNLSDDVNDLPEGHGVQVEHSEPELPSGKQQFSLAYNRFVCQEFSKKIRVTFRRNAIEESQVKVKTEINNANLILEGKIQREETTSYEADDSDSERIDADKISPIPRIKWVYYTPTNQKISIPKLEHCKLQPGVIWANHNRHNLYEINEKPNVNIFNLNYDQNDQVDNIFFKKVTGIKKTPANFRPCQSQRATLTNQVDAHHSEIALAPWGNHISDCAFGVDKVKDPFGPSHSKVENYLKNSNLVPRSNLSNDSEHDFTFIQEGNDFKIQESQPSQRIKRKSSTEEFIVNKKSFNLEPNKCENTKMFNFGSQDRNMFDFNVIM